MTRPSNDDKLKEVVRILAEKCYDDQNIGTYFDSLKHIYEESSFRHSYAQMYSQITELDRGKGNLENLQSNTRMILDLLSSQKGLCDSAKKGIYKFCDHILLEIAQFQFFIGIEKSTQTKIKAALTKKINETIDSAKQEINNEVVKTKEKSDKLQKDYVAILGIFSSIIVAFTGGIKISSTVVEKLGEIIKNSSPMNAFLEIAWISGFWIILIWMLLFFIAKICDKVVTKWVTIVPCLAFLLIAFAIFVNFQ